MLEKYFSLESMPSENENNITKLRNNGFETFVYGGRTLHGDL